MIYKFAELEQKCFSRPWSASMLSEAQDSGAYIFVAVTVGNDAGDNAGGEIVGYACGSMAGDQGEVQRVCVLNEFRGRGYGERLMRELFTAFTAVGISEIFLEVRAGNVPARALYEKLGFVNAGVRKRYYGDEDAVVYMLSNK